MAKFYWGRGVKPTPAGGYAAFEVFGVGYSPARSFLGDAIASLGIPSSALHHPRCSCRGPMTPEVEAAADREEAAAKAEAARPISELIAGLDAAKDAVNAAREALRAAEVREEAAAERIAKRLGCDSDGLAPRGSSVPTVAKDGVLHTIHFFRHGTYRGNRPEVVLTPVKLLS